MGKIVNRAELAEIHGTSLPTISAWVRKGCPFRKAGAKGREWEFDTAEVAEWREAQAVAAAVGDTAAMDIEAVKKRKLLAETVIAEIEAAKLRRQVIEIDEVGKVVGEDYARCKARLRSIPTKAASAVLEAAAGDAAVAEITDVLRTMIDEALSELSSFTDEGLDDEEDGPGEE